MHEKNGIKIDLGENPAILGELAHSSARKLGIMDFAQFRRHQESRPFPPLSPIMSIYDGPIELKRTTFEMVNQQKKIAHQKAVIQYEQDKRHSDLLKLYPADLAGYGAYLIDYHPQVLAFFGQRRPFPICEESRRLHTYITGGSGSGKSECLKSLVWHYLTEDVSTALVFIDPHSDVARQVAQFRPNRDNDRLVYIEPRINDKAFPGLNPFDIGGKEGMTDIEAEAYADEFIHAFQEILGGTLTDQMETVLKNTVPVIVKLPGSTVYDLIKFLRPQQKPTKGRLEDQPEPYEATRYVEFAKASFQNAEMLDFLEGQFENDTGYVTTRNAITTRLRGVFGNTLMQALFKGPRTVRIEDLIPQRKLIVFNLGKLKRDTSTVGRFLLITLKIFALNQAQIPVRNRTPCHVFVDECQKFVTESLTDILQEARKFCVFLTLAQQSAGSKMSSEMFEAVRTNCAIKMAGVNSGLSLDIMAKETGVPAQTIAEFRKGQFVLYQREAKTKLAIVRMPTNTLRNSASMPVGEWACLLKAQLATYYRTPEQTQTRAAPQQQTTNVPFDPLAADIAPLMS